MYLVLLPSEKQKMDKKDQSGGLNAKLCFNYIFLLTNIFFCDKIYKTKKRKECYYETNNIINIVDCYSFNIGSLRVMRRGRRSLRYGFQR